MSSPFARKLPIGFIIFGVLIAGVSAFGDALGLGGSREVGAAQVVGIEIGVLFVLLGVGIAHIRPERLSQFAAKPGLSLFNLFRSPLDFWVFLTFLLVYFAFFLYPGFLNDSFKIRYIHEFIPDQGRIGFDIRSIVEHVEAWYVQGVSPYSDGFIAYPPLTLALFSGFTLLDYTVYFRLISFITLVCYGVSTLVIPMWITGRDKSRLVLFIFLTGLFSYGFQFELERGQFNVIAFTCCLLGIYLFHFERESLRFWAYFFFSLAVQMKIYPIFFIFLFIKDWRDWKINMKRLIGLGVANFLLLFIFGYQMFLDFVRIVTAYQFDYDSNRHENLSIKGFVHSLAGGQVTEMPDALLAMLKSSIPAMEILLYSLLGFCLVVVIGLLLRRNSRGFSPALLLWCTIAALIVPSVSNDYKLSILAAPVAIVLSGGFGGQDVRGRVLPVLAVIGISLAYWTTLYPYTVKPDILSRHFPALLVLLLSGVLLQWLTAESSDPVPA